MITPESLIGDGSEDNHQLALLCWCALNFKIYPELRWLHHSPNGGFRNKREAGRLKAMGVKRGFPDLFLPIPIAKWHGLFIELKRLKGGIISLEQKDWIAFLRGQGYGAVVCHGWLEARNVLTEYLKYETQKGSQNVY